VNLEFQGVQHVLFLLPAKAAKASGTVYGAKEESGGNRAHGTRRTPRFLNAGGDGEPTL
jgi:hypothetical protein